MTAFNIRRIALLLLLSLVSVQAGADVFNDVLERGKLRVGVSEFIPWTMKNKTGELIGSEVDLANKLASDMGVAVEIRVYEWAQIIPALQKGEIDVIAAGMSITPARALLVNFTRPFAESGVVLVTNTALTKDIGSLRELNDPKYRIVVAKDTLSNSVAATLFDKANLQTFATPALAEKEVIEGRAYAYVGGIVESKFLALRHGDVVDVPMAEPLVGSREALAVRKGEQEMLNFLNAWIEARSADKWIATTRSYWFETLDWAGEIER